MLYHPLSFLSEIEDTADIVGRGQVQLHLPYARGTGGPEAQGEGALMLRSHALAGREHTEITESPSAHVVGYCLRAALIRYGRAFPISPLPIFRSSSDRSM